MTQPKPATSAPRTARQPGGGGRGAARGQHVVDDQHPLAGLQRILVDLEGVDPVLELVVLDVHVPRQLAGLADRHETGPEAHRDRRGDDEAAGFDPDDLVDRRARRRRRPAPSRTRTGPVRWPAAG